MATKNTTVKSNVNLDEEARKPGKIKTGKLDFETNTVKFEDDNEDHEDMDEPSAVKDHKSSATVKPSKKQAAKDMKASLEKEDATIKGDILTIPLKPSQRPTPPAHLRITIEAPKDAKEIITVKDLVTEFDMDGKKIRRIIRNLNYKAPSTGDTGFGAKARYEWEPNSKILAKIKAALNEELEA
jgi:hypothetical protein